MGAIQEVGAQDPRVVAVQPIAPATVCFNESGYLEANPDVAVAVRNGVFRSGRDHFDRYGHAENRPCVTSEFREARVAKMAKLRPFLRRDLPHTWRGETVDYLSAELRALSGISDTTAVSGNGYNPSNIDTINTYPAGLVLDCGSGYRGEYYPNVVNFEIVDYPTTDVLGVGEELPFLDNTFDAVFSISVLEHVKNPWRCALEITRVLKPGGTLQCSVPFIFPRHGFPHHYFNMTDQGIRSLFEPGIDIETLDIPAALHPVVAFSEIVKYWNRGLPPDAAERFLSLPLSTFMGGWPDLINEDWCRDLPMTTQFELASGIYLIGAKR